MTAPETNPPAQTPQSNRPARCRRFWLCGGGIILALLLGGLLFSALGHHGVGRQHFDSKGPRAAVQKFQEFHYPKQIAQAQPMCTAFGWPILVRMTANSTSFLRNFQIGPVKFSPHFADVQMTRDTAEGKSILFVQLRDVNGVWKFRNIFIKQFNDMKVGLWAGYIYQHPEALKERLVASNDANVDGNLQRFNSATTAIKNVLDIFIKLKTLASNKNS